MVRDKAFCLLSVLLLVSLTLSACGSQQTPAGETPTVAESTPGTTTIATPAETPPAVPKTLVVCQGQEPSSLYLYATRELAAAHILAAIYDGPIDTVSYSYQAVALEKLPSLADGDAVIRQVQVGIGDWVVDDRGDPVPLTDALTQAVLLRPAGCASSECAVSWLPVSGTLTMDQMVVTFTLKAGLTWADGTPDKASDSVYGWTLNADPDTPNGSRYLYERSASYVAPDDRTVVWTGLPGYRDRSYMTNLNDLLPEHILGQYTAQELPAIPEASRTPLGYGPFTVEEWVPGDHITVVRNPYYFRAREGLPYLDTIVYRFIGEDANPAIAAALAGECDILTQDIGLESQAPLLHDLEATGVLVAVFVTGTQFEHLDWCIRPTATYERPDFFSDQRMREAMAACMDRQRIVDDLLYGESTVPNVYIPSEHPLYASDVKVHAYDPAYGQQLLDEMGWRDIDEDGIRECDTCTTPGAEQGVTDLQFKWTSSVSPLRIAYVQSLQEDLRACGFDVILETLPSSEWFAPGPDGPLGGLHYDVGSFTWLSAVEPPCSLYMTSQIPSEENGWAGQNYVGFSDPAFDEACSRALESLPGTAEYVRYHQEAQRIFAEELPSLPLYLRLKIAAHRPEVQNFALDSTAGSEMWNAENLDIVAP
jgi:peptide/nickel transport system substrate-binding protein